MQKLSDTQLRDKTAEFKKRLKNGESLDDLLVEVFAVSHGFELLNSLCNSQALT